MIKRFGLVLILCLLPLPVCGQTFFQDFESAEVGDSIFDYGVGGNYFVDEVGVGGSNGFQIDVANSVPVFLSVFPLVNFHIQNPGDQLTISVDAQVSLTGGQTIFENGDVLFDFAFINGSDLVLGQFTVSSSTNSFSARQFVDANGNELLVTVPDFKPLNKIGISDGLQGVSEFIRLELVVRKQAEANYQMTTSVLDLEGNLLVRNSLIGIDLSSVVDSDSMFPILTALNSNHPYFEWIRYDNFLYCLDQGEAFVLGDANGDGRTDLLDVAPFVELINDSEFSLAGDINQDGAVNLLDVDGFVDLLIGL